MRVCEAQGSFNPLTLVFRVWCVEVGYEIVVFLVYVLLEDINVLVMFLLLHESIQFLIYQLYFCFLFKDWQGSFGRLCAYFPVSVVHSIVLDC